VRRDEDWGKFFGMKIACITGKVKDIAGSSMEDSVLSVTDSAIYDSRTGKGKKSR